MSAIDPTVPPRTSTTTPSYLDREGSWRGWLLTRDHKRKRKSAAGDRIGEYA